MTPFILNMSSKYCVCVTIVLIWCIEFSSNASLSNVELKKYKHLLEGQGLYSSEDDVNILTAHNFNEQIYGKKHALYVEFYNSWCGFCQRFAPSWKALATDIKGWKDMISVAAVDCSDEDNSPICREFEIMAYPTLRYFHENYQEGPGKIGVDVSKGDDVYSHKKFLIQQIINEQREGRGIGFPNILPYVYQNFDNLHDDVPSATKFVFHVIERENSLMGPELAFDFKTIPDLVVKYSFFNNTALIQNAKVSKTPAIFVQDEFKGTDLLSDTADTRETMRTAIKEYLRRNNIIVPEMITKKPIYTGKWLDADVPDMSELMEAREQENLKYKIKAMGDVVFQADLETVLRYSLKHEVSSVKVISGEKQAALVKYLKVLAKYFPIGRQGQKFLDDLRDYVINTGDYVLGSDIARFLNEAEEEGKEVFSSPPRWLGCKGSSSKHRGYPCGLWKLFHYLTVNAAKQNADDLDAYPREILDAMLDYIKHFFGCSDCSKHFQEMVVEKDMKSVSSLDSAILWLWMAHNSVNLRLAGDETEDPEFPKEQFPIPQHCPTCRNSDHSWNLPEVLEYLKKTYSRINIRYIGSDIKILHMGLEGAAVGNGSSSVLFQKVDTSMCFILYVGSFILIVILIRMFLKRGYKKKMYVHDLLGKV